MDELPEFSRSALEILRQPLEEGRVTISRASGSRAFPCRFMLVAAMNPCRCGWYGSQSRACTCTEADVRKYRSRLSGPLLDRIDIFVQVPALKYGELRDESPEEPSAAVLSRVNAARERQRARYDGVFANSALSHGELARFCALGPESEALMRDAYSRLGLTARSYDRVLRVARTAADIEGSEGILPRHLAEALQYRGFDPRLS